MLQASGFYDIIDLMGWITDDGRHEGYLAAQFIDGQLGRGITGGGIPSDQIVVGAAVEDSDGTWSYPTRSAGEVTGWVICCDCSQPDSIGPPTTWVGQAFTRVPSKALEDLAEGRIYAPDDEVAHVSERADVEDAAVLSWRAEHTLSLEAIAEVAAATAAAHAAADRLDDAVGFARQTGASWAAIGEAAGISRQSAHARWHRASA